MQPETLKTTTTTSPTVSNSDNNKCRQEQRSNNNIDFDLVQHLYELTERLQRNDPTLKHLEPIASQFSSNGGTLAYTALLLEHESVQNAYKECFRACFGNQHVHSITLTALPEAELRFAIEHIQHLHSLHTIIIQHTVRSQSLHVEDLIRLFNAQIPIPSLHQKGLKKIKIDTRIAIRTQNQIIQLANVLCRMINLQEISLHILPRCSMERPTLSMQPIIEVFANYLPNLKSIQIQLGYDHNPFHRPMISNNNTEVLTKLLSKSKLKRLQLDNFGLQPIHMEAITSVLRNNNTSKLKHLQIARNGIQYICIAESLCEIIKKTNYTLESCTLWTPDECRRLGGILYHQEHLNMWCLLNKYGRNKLLEDSNYEDYKLWFKTIEKIASIARPAQQQPLSVLESFANNNSSTNNNNNNPSNRQSLGALYTLIRSNPMMALFMMRPSSSSSSSSVDKSKNNISNNSSDSVVVITTSSNQSSTTTLPYKRKESSSSTMSAEAGSTTKDPNSAAATTTLIHGAKEEYDVQQQQQQQPVLFEKRKNKKLNKQSIKTKSYSSTQFKEINNNNNNLPVRSQSSFSYFLRSSSNNKNNDGAYNSIYSP